MANTVKLKKKTIYSSITLAIVAVIVLSIFLLSQDSLDIEIKTKPSEKEIEIYKKAIFDSISCQYSCELIEADVNGQKSYLPDTNCANECTTKIREQNFDKERYTEEILLNDDLFKDLDSAISLCRQESVGDHGALTLENSEQFFDCTKQKLTELKESYEYLSETTKVLEETI